LLLPCLSCEAESNFYATQTSVSEASGIDLETRLGYGRATVDVVLAS